VKRLPSADCSLSIEAMAIFVVAMVLSIAAAPLIAAGQQTGKVSRIGFLSPGGATWAPTDAFRQGLRELGYVEGKNVLVEYRWGEGDAARLSALAVELARLRVELLVAANNLAVLAAKQANSNLPIVCAACSEPVGTGLVASLAHPGGNVTGLSLITPELSGKRLQLLQETLPSIRRVAMLWDAGHVGMADRVRESEAAALRLGVKLHVEWVKDPAHLERAFATLAQTRPDAFITTVEPFTEGHRQRIVDFAAQQRLPAIYEDREFVDAGGLMAYGPGLAANYRRAAAYVDKILKGARPADLPVEQPTTFEFVINLRTAKALGLMIPRSVLARADEVIP
jgi:putative tryptophan/tyrosine transport system substrate-binding protein